MFLTPDEIKRRATYHPPTQEARELHEKVRALYEAGAEFLNSLPDCRETSTAQTRLEEVMFWANASIARNHDKL